MSFSIIDRPVGLYLLVVMGKTSRLEAAIMDFTLSVWSYSIPVVLIRLFDSENIEVGVGMLFLSL